MDEKRYALVHIYIAGRVQGVGFRCGRSVE